MAFLRCIYKIPALILWFFLIFLVSVPFQITRRRSPKPLAPVVSLCLKGFARIARLNIRVHGRLPEDGNLFVSNHLSYLDGIVEGALLKIRWTTRADASKWPVVGFVVGAGNPIWVDRSSRSASKKTLEELGETLKEGLSLLVWPEGTSSDGRHGVLPFKSTAFEAAAILDRPIYPLIIHYPDNDVYWYGDMDFFPHFIKMLSKPNIEADIHVLSAVSPEGRDRKELAALLSGIMDKEYRRIYTAAQRGDEADS